FLYANGQGAPQDYVQAYKWFNVAASYSTNSEYRDNAAKNRDIMADRMTPEQIKQAQQLATAWKPRKMP
ncbi:MAG: sel1 repeat family protein, partial [Methylovirgula sp.]